MDINSSVKITGIQKSVSDEPTIVEQKASYSFKNGNHYIRYDEEGIRNTIKISPGQVTVSKSGDVIARLDYIVDEEACCVYQTPMGNFEMNITTRSVRTSVNLFNEITTEIRYDQVINGQRIDDCYLEIVLKGL